MHEDAMTLRGNLLEDGYCVANEVLDATMLERLREAAAEARTRHESQDGSNFGSLIKCEYESPVFADLIAWPKSLGLLQAMGFDDVRWMSFFLINKPPGGPALWWHQDWFLWDDPVSAAAVPTQVFLSYYLEDTSEELGCLRVIPGSHRRRHPLHDRLPDHGTVKDELPHDHWMLEDVEGSVNVPVPAGSLVIADARVLHSARANRSERHRPLILGWYVLDYPALSSAMQQTFSLGWGRHLFKPPHWWEGDAGDCVRPLIFDPPRDGEGIKANRVPGKYLAR